MGEDRSKEENPFGVSFWLQHSSEDTRGGFVDPGNGLPSPKATVHFGASRAGEEQEVPFAVKPAPCFGCPSLHCNVPVLTALQQPQSFLLQPRTLLALFTERGARERIISNLQQRSSHTHNDMACSRAAASWKSRGIRGTDCG